MGFEQIWQEKFSSALDEHAGVEIGEHVMCGHPSVEDSIFPEAVIQWSAAAMERLEQAVDSKCARSVMLDCGCQYPSDAIEPIATEYKRQADITQALDSLQHLFLQFLKDDLVLPDEMIEEVVELGWGLAGKQSDKAVIATKIPKSENLAAYLKEKDLEKRRQLYCHCPRIRNAIALGIEISPTYCYCGGGFYRGIWERILGHEVQVELLQSILNGDEVCQFRIHWG